MKRSYNKSDWLGHVADPIRCIEWPGCRNEAGYGIVSRKRRQYRAHRIAWEVRYGPIPDDLCVLHKCDNPPCVNVDHLFLGTRTDNAADRERKGRSKRKDGPYSPSAKLTLSQARQAKYSSVPCNTLAERFGVTKETIRRIRYRNGWANI